jgi:microcin C transport system permease protein
MRLKPKITPLTRERWRRFKATRRGYWSLWIFLFLFSISLFSEFIANDKPLLVNYDGQLYTPVFFSYSSKTFGDEFDFEADYSDPYLQELIEKKGWMLWPPVRFSYDTLNRDIDGPTPSPPTRDNWLGTDDKSRDVLAGILYGFRISVLFGFALTLFSAIIGVSVGAIQGYFGGRIDLLGQRFIEVWSGMPTLFLLIILSSVIEPNFWWLLVITVLFGWMGFVGAVRAEFLRGRNMEYVKAAQVMGVSDFTIMWRHILPNAMVATLTFMPFVLGASVTTLTSLDFLGFGLPVESPSLGKLLTQGKDNLQAPWLGLSVFIVLSVMLGLLVLIGEAVRDAFDPYRQEGKH